MNQIRGCNQSKYVTKRQEKKDNDSLFSHNLIFIFARRSCEAQSHCRTMHSLRHERSPRNATGPGVAVYRTRCCAWILGLPPFSLEIRSRLCRPLVSNMRTKSVRVFGYNLSEDWY